MKFCPDSFFTCTVLEIAAATLCKSEYRNFGGQIGGGKGEVPSAGVDPVTLSEDGAYHFLDLLRTSLRQRM